MFKFTAKMLIAPKVASDELNGFTIIPLEEFAQEGGGAMPKSGADDDETDEKDGPKKKNEEAEKKEPKKNEKPKAKKPSEPEEFGLGSTHRVVPEEEMKDYLGRAKTKTRTVQDPYRMPYIHHQSIQLVDGGGKELDIDALKAAIKKRPSKLLKQNKKMQHSDGHSTQFYNVGLPALKGLVVNEKTDEFVVVDTCPGSGACKTFCYAMKGFYVMFKDTSMMMTQTLNFLVNEPKRFEARLKAEIAAAIATADEGVDVVIRWHDAGDFFSPQYMNLAYNVARAFPDNDFYAYTKIADVAESAKPDNFKINFSDGALPREQNRVNMTQIKHSVVVPKEMFTDLIARDDKKRVLKSEDGQIQFKDAASWNEFKDRLVQKYKIEKDSILIYNEYMQMKSEDELGDDPMQWNVVVPPGGGDNSANDNAVLGSYLMFH